MDCDSFSITPQIRCAECESVAWSFNFLKPEIQKSNSADPKNMSSFKKVYLIASQDWHDKGSSQIIQGQLSTAQLYHTATFKAESVERHEEKCRNPGQLCLLCLNTWPTEPLAALVFTVFPVSSHYLGGIGGSSQGHACCPTLNIWKYLQLQLRRFPLVWLETEQQACKPGGMITCIRTTWPFHLKCTPLGSTQHDSTWISVYMALHLDFNKNVSPQPTPQRLLCMQTFKSHQVTQW